MVADLMDWNNTHNVFYIGKTRNVSTAFAALPEDSTPANLFEHMHDNDAFRSANDIDQEQESITNFSSVLQAQAENETTVVEKTVVHIETSTNAEEAANKFTGERLFEVRASNKFAHYEDRFPKMFPHLFPFGRGHPNERHRRVKVSFQDCCKHYLHLYSRRFAQDSHFILYAFDTIAMSKAYENLSVSLNLRPNMYREVSVITSEQLQTALQNDAQRRRGRFVPISKTPAEKILQNIKLSAAAVMGSNEEASRHRREALSYLQRFGMCQIFLTLTPNNSNGITICYYAGKAKTP